MAEQQWQTEKLAFVGEPVGTNEYEAACTLAEDCELRAGLIVPRFDDFRVTTSAAQRACMVDVGSGTLRWKNSSGYCFAYGDDAYFINADGNWTWVKPDGSEQVLAEPPAPTLTMLEPNSWVYHFWSDTRFNWNVPPQQGYPEWTNVSGAVERTYTFPAPQPQLPFARWFWFLLIVPDGAEHSLQVAINGGDVPTFYRRDGAFLWVWVDASAADLTTFQSFGFRYSLQNTHTVSIGWGNVYVEGQLQAGRHVYAATIERNGVESVLGATRSVAATPGKPQIELPSAGVRGRVSGLQAGDIVRVYRATEGQYILVAESTATTSHVYFYDWGDHSTNPYRPSGKLPYGPAAVVGNRAVVAAGRTLWISQAGNPIRFGATAINDDNQDAYTIILPAAIAAIAPAEGGVIAHTRRGQYLVPLSPQYDNDLLHMRPPALIDDRAASDFRAAAVGAFISDGRLFVDGQLVASGLSDSSWVVRTAGRVYVIYNDSSQGWCLIWSPQEWAGALRWKMPHPVSWAFSYGDDVFVATTNGIYQVAGSVHRKPSCRWRTGKRFMPMLSAIRFVHLAGAAYSVKLIRPGKPDVTLVNVSGRANVPAGEQTHEWQLELNVAQSDAVYQCYISYETGVQ